ncbi:asparaginase [Mesorhizobium sp. SP-1A]|uniref:asparaginase n=1 Tax=Mesorhizobium sp. SP-1A TaxID=3077840 RepID=UPI0028F6FE6F|nr:asparaginase domain-containing protein [Mesorhizobium sp. SP-1A]
MNLGNRSDQPDADGPRNLADAIRVAADSSSAGLGVMVVFDGKVLCAVDATKVHSSRTTGFDSSGFGPLGEVDDGSVLIVRRPPSYPRLRGQGIETRVDLLPLTMGADERLFEAAIASGAKGIVLEGFGRGNGTPKIVEAVSRATAQSIPTLVTSRCPQGRVLPLYADGGGRDLEDAGAILAGRLQGPKARILLSLALANGYHDDLAKLCAKLGR